ncbi:MAG: hypothetical protein HY242_09095 [Afipia sp.]|nr:hypothetical protein [Afipia sp.]
MAIFTLTITSRTPRFGETAHQERQQVSSLLKFAAERIGSGQAPQGSANIQAAGQEDPGNCSYTFGAGSLNQGL